MHSDAGPCNDHLRAMHELQAQGQCYQASQHSLNAGCLPASHPCHLTAASPSPTAWASLALQQLALQQRMQGCAAHNLNLALAAPAAAASNPPVFDPALLHRLRVWGPAGVGGVGAGFFFPAGVAAGLPFAPLQPAYAAGFGGLSCGAWGR